MGATSVSPDDDPDRDALSGDAATRQLVAAAVGDRCVSCDAPLASDQRYCLNCGERRGKSRFSAVNTVGHQPAASAGGPAVPNERRRRRLSSGASLVAGIATLLLAMGVGVEIGRTGNSGTASTQRASGPSVQVVTVGGGSAGTSVSHAKRAKTKAAKKQTTLHLSKKVAAKANAAASKVLGSSSNNLAPPTVQPGQSCAHGAGCQGGKFTGNFFGG